MKALSVLILLGFCVFQRTVDSIITIFPHISIGSHFDKIVLFGSEVFERCAEPAAADRNISVAFVFVQGIGNLVTACT